MRRHTPTTKTRLLRSIPGLEHAGRRELEAIEQVVDDVPIRSGTVLQRAGWLAREAFVLFDDRGVRFVGFEAMASHKPAEVTIVADRAAEALVVAPGAFAALMDLPAFAQALRSPVASRSLPSTSLVVVPA